MTPFWSAKKQSAAPEAGNSSSRPPAAVRVMREDLERIKKGDEPAQLPADGQQPSDIRSGRASSPSTASPFSSGGDIFQPHAGGAEGRTENPFNVVSGSPRQPLRDFSQRPTLGNGLTPLAPEGKPLARQPGNAKKRLLIGGILLSSLLLILGGASYFFMRDNAADPDPSSVSDSGEESPAEMVPMPPQSLPFALDKPNYLSLNTEIVSPQDIRQILLHTAERIAESQMTELVEFLVTDQNNNPLAFSRFAFLLNLDLDPDTLALIDETFSLYAYDDAGQVRFGLALTFKDAPAMAAALAKTETALPYALRALILEPGILVPQSIPFRSTLYDRFALRFANIDSSRNLSLDYALTGQQWFIGTSKQTLRVMLDAHAK